MRNRLRRRRLLLEDNLSQSDEYSPEELERQAYHAAVKLLSSRDHSEFELVRKLKQRNHDADTIGAVLETLRQANYVDDERYANLFAEQRIGKGYGPLSVRSRLSERGIESRLIETALDSVSPDWVEQACNVLLKRFDANILSSRDAKDESRISRFLASRGFTQGVALRALKMARHNSDANGHDDGNDDYRA